MNSKTLDFCWTFGMFAYLNFDTSIVEDILSIIRFITRSYKIKNGNSGILDVEGQITDQNEHLADLCDVKLYPNVIILLVL